MPAAGQESPELLALERYVPGVTAAFPRVPLTRLPTPVRRLEALARARGLGEIWIKHDDRTGVLYGGNKPRKLEFLLGAARARGYRTVITFGGIGTHHGLATAICAREAGMRCVLVLMPQPVTDHVRRCLLLDHAFGAEMHLAPSVAGIVAQSLARCARGLLRNDLPWVVPTGGTSARGALGYINAACELAEQVRRGELPEPAFIFTPLGSGGTVAGLAAGLKLAGLRSRVVGVLVTDILPPSTHRLAGLARGALLLLRGAKLECPNVMVQPSDITVIESHLGERYGAPTAEGEDAVRLLRETEAVTLETTYTAKCAAALLHYAKQAPYAGQPLLFWNTYSSVDPAASLERLPEYPELPAAFHRFFR
jgi:D-cysteine desulfhydrase